MTDVVTTAQMRMQTRGTEPGPPYGARMGSDMVAPVQSYDSRLFWNPEATSANDKLAVSSMATQSAVQAKKLTQQLALTHASARWKVRDAKGRAAWKADLEDRLSALDLYDTSKEPPPAFELVQMAFLQLELPNVNSGSQRIYLTLF